MSAQHQFAVVVSDMRMPGLDGLEFLARVREISPCTVRIILSGNADLGAADHAQRDGLVYRFLSKPCSRESLTQCLRSMD